MWTDSTTVLQWSSSTSKLPVLMAHRGSEVLESTTIDELFLVSSCDNPSDSSNRGKTAEALKENRMVKIPHRLKTKKWPFYQ